MGAKAERILGLDPRWSLEPHGYGSSQLTILTCETLPQRAGFQLASLHCLKLQKAPSRIQGRLQNTFPRMLSWEQGYAVGKQRRSRIGHQDENSAPANQTQPQAACRRSHAKPRGQGVFTAAGHQTNGRVTIRSAPQVFPARGRSTEVARTRRSREINE